MGKREVERRGAWRGEVGGGMREVRGGGGGGGGGEHG